MSKRVFVKEVRENIVHMLLIDVLFLVSLSLGRHNCRVVSTEEGPSPKIYLF